MTKFRVWLYNLVFRWLHKHDDHVRVWQEGETCPGLPSCDLTVAYLLGYQKGREAARENE